MTVVKKLPVGVVGEIADSSIARVLTKTTGTGGVEIGKAITETAGVVANGGTGGDNFVGIAVSPKQYAKDGLGSTMQVKANSFVEALSFGRVWVKVADAVTVGAQATFDASGNISSATGAGKVAIANSKFLTAATGGTGDEVALLQLS